MERNIILTQIPLEELKDIISGCVREEMKRASNQIDHSSDELIKIDDAVKLFHVSKVTIYKWRKKGILPYHRIASRVYFKKSELLEAIKASPKYKRNKN